MSKKISLNEKKVVIGFTGRVDSVVSAYLLKKQGFDVVAVSILFSPRESESGLLSLYDDDEKEIEVPFYGQNSLDDLNHIQRIASELGLSFYAVDASSEYINLVNDKLLASRCAGVSYSPELDTHNLLLKILCDKANLLQAKYMSCGHYAKISMATATKSSKLHRSHDIDHDQSDLLSKVTPDLFSRLLLPLADMRKVEVLKVASTIKTKLLDEKAPWAKTLESISFTHFIEQRIAPSLIKNGQVIDYMTGNLIADHDGIHKFFIGENKLNKKIENMAEASPIVADINFSDGTIYTMKKDQFVCDSLVLNHLEIDDEDDISQELSCFASQVGKKIKMKGQLQVKNNGYATFKFSQTLNEIFARGESIVFYSHDKEGAKLLGYGEVFNYGTMINGELSHLPYREEEDLGENNAIKPYHFAY